MPTASTWARKTCTIARPAACWAGDKIIGITVNTVEQALEAASLGADYLGVSPIFATRTKPDAGEPAGLSLLREIRARVRLPLVAIGGITLDNAPDVIQAGADSLCAISAVVTRPDVRAAIQSFRGSSRDSPLAR